MIRGKRISTEVGTISLLCVSLFFISQIMGAEEFYRAIFEPESAAAAITVAPVTTPVAPTLPAAALHINMVSEVINAERGDKGVIMQKMELQNDLNRTAAIGIEGFEVKSSNSGAAIATVNFDGVYLYQGDRLIATGASSNTSIAFGKAYVNVPAGESSLLTLRGDIGTGAASGSLTFSIKFDTTPGTGGAVTFTPTVVEGRSSVVNILNEVSDVSLLATILPNETVSLDKGAAGVQLIAVKLANTGKENLTVSALKSQGSFATSCVSNVALYVDGTSQTAQPAVSDNEAALSGLAIAIPVGGAVTAALKGDVAEACGKSALTFGVQEGGIKAAGVTSAKPATVTVAGSSSILNLFAKKNDGIYVSYAAKFLTAKKGDRKAPLQEIQIVGAKNEDVVLSGMTFHANVLSGSNAKDATGTLDAVYLYAGATLIGTATLNADRDYVISESYTIAQGKTVKLSLKGDVSAAAEAKSIRVAFPDNGRGYNARGAVSGKAVTVRLLGAAAHLLIIDPAGCTVTTQTDGTVTECATNETTETTETTAPVAPVIKDGDIIRAIGAIDVYIVKIVDGSKFKRLILSPTVFRSYKHLKWENIIEVDQATLDSFTTSNLVRVAGSGTVWQLQPNADKGIRHRFNARAYDEKSVYEINAQDENAYEQGTPIGQ